MFIISIFASVMPNERIIMHTNPIPPSHLGSSQLEYPVDALGDMPVKAELEVADFHCEFLDVQH